MLKNPFMLAYYGGAWISFIYLVFFDGYVYTWWNWLIAVPISFFLSGVWPIYWLILRPAFYFTGVS
ncbi:MAG: hypothetical protein KUL86_06950 [Castellaniella sp.]|nr:hypothetical protein [Castellaniella sp.]